MPAFCIVKFTCLFAYRLSSTNKKSTGRSRCLKDREPVQGFTEAYSEGSTQIIFVLAYLVPLDGIDHGLRQT